MESPLPNSKKALPRCIFVTGGPGTGKGTQCAKLVQDPGYAHISIGDIMRNEIKSGSPDGKQIESIVKAGNLVPKELTVRLLLKTLENIKADAVLIDGFPRSVDQAVYMEQHAIRIDYILHLDVDDEQVLLERLIERGKSSGRADDNPETIMHRFNVYKSESAPVLAIYEPFGYVRRIDSFAAIAEVYKRTLRGLRPELLCIIGPNFSGKSTLSMHLASRYSFSVVTLNEIKTRKKMGKKVMLTDDQEIVDAVIKYLQKTRSYRVIIENFPENLSQARIFGVLSGDPDMVINLRCPQDVAQERLLKLDKADPRYMQPAVYSRVYNQFSENVVPIAEYYRSRKVNYGEISTGGVSSLSVLKQSSALVEPEVILLMGPQHEAVNKYFSKLGYKLVDAEKLIRVFRFERGLSHSSNAHNLSDDEELIDILFKLIFSGNRCRKFAIYNFAPNNLELVMRFEKEVCRIKEVYYISDTISPSDAVGNYLFNSHKFTHIKRSLLPSELDSADFREIDTLIAEANGAQKSWVIALIGATLTGKTTIANYMQQKYGFVPINFEEVYEETKTVMSTEEEPKDALSFGEFRKGLGLYLEKRPGKRFIIDGMPATDYLMLPDSEFGDLVLPEVNEDNPGQEEANKDLRAAFIAKRFEDLLSGIHLLTVIEFKCLIKILKTRFKQKNEIPEEEEIPADGVNEIKETGLIYKKLAREEEAPSSNSYKIPKRIVFDTSKITLPEMKQILDTYYTRKLILVRNHVKGAKEFIKRLAWSYNIKYVDFWESVQEYIEGEDELAVKLRNHNISSEVKFEVIARSMKNAPLRDYFVILGGFEIDLNEQYMSGIDEFVALESMLGELFMLISVMPQSEEYSMPELPTRQRKQPKKEEDEEDPGKQDEDEETSQANVTKVEFQPEEPEVIPMWNNYQRANMSMIFQNFKGRVANFTSIAKSDYENFFSSALTVSDNRFNLHVLASPQDFE